MLIYDNWEYHPIYGTYTRIVYKKVGKDSLIMFGRQYKSMDLFM